MWFLWIIPIGFAFTANSTDCTDVLHQLRTAHKLQIESSAAVNDTVIYTLTERYGLKKKTAEVFCELKPA